MYVHVGLESVGHEDIEQNLNTAPAVSRNRGYRWTPSNSPSQTHCPGVCVCVCMWKVLPTRIPTAVAMLFLHFARFPLTFVPVLWTDSGPQLPCLVCFEHMSCMGFGQPWLQLCCVTVPKEVHKEYHNPPPTPNKSLWEPIRKHIRSFLVTVFGNKLTFS